MEARVLAALIAFAVLVGVGIGWQLPRGESSTMVLERVVTLTVTSKETVTWTLFEGGVRTTVTVTKPLGPALKLMLPSGTYDCNTSALVISVLIVNAGDEPATLELAKITTGLKGVREKNRFVAGPGIFQFQELSQTVLRPEEDISLTILYAITDEAELSKYVRRSPLGTPILPLNLTIPYGSERKSSELRLEAVFLDVLGDCRQDFLGGNGPSAAQDEGVPGEETDEGTPGEESYEESHEAAQQTTDRTALLKISLSDAEPTVGSILHINASLRNTGHEEVLIEYFVGQLFEVVIRDGAGSPVYVHSETGFQRYLMAAPVHLRLAPGESLTKTLEVKLAFSRGAERGSPLPPGTYTLTVYLTAAVEGQPSGVIDGIKAYASATTTITIMTQ